MSEEVRFIVVGASHPHSIVLTAGLIEAGARCVGVVDTGDTDPLFELLYPDLERQSGQQLHSSEIDLAVVAGVPDTRADWSVRALEANIDVLCAKPSVITRAGLNAIGTAVDSSSARWWVAYTEHLTSPAMQLADQQVAAGRIGDVVHVAGFGPHRLGDDRPAWFGDPHRAGATLTDLASHQIHHVVRLLGTTKLELVAATATPANGRSHPAASADLMLRADNGSGYVHVDWLTPDGLPTWGDVRLMITGEHGTIEVRPNIDLRSGDQHGSETCLIVDRDGTELIDCSEQPVSWAQQLCADVVDATERLISTRHCLAVSELALRAGELSA